MLLSVVYMYCTVIIYNTAKVYIKSWYGRLYSQLQEWLTRIYDITEEEKKSTMDIVDEQLSIECNAE